MPQLAQTTTPELVPPEGGVLHRLSVPPSRYSTWEAALRAGAPDTSRENSVRRAGHLFEPVPVDNGPVSLVLLWMGMKSVTPTDHANAWATENGLLLTSPYDVFALSAMFPYLYEEYGLSGAGLVATQPCNIIEPYVCGIWQSKKYTARQAELVATNFKFEDRTMFVYREQ